MVDYVLNQLLRLVSIPSVSGQEGEILFYIEEELFRIGVSFERQRVEGSWYNLLVGDVQNPDLIIAAHVDTVAPLDGMPPKPVVEDGFIKGLGVLDDKVGVASLLGLCNIFREGIEKKGVLLAFLVDEEKSGLGSETLASSIKAKGALIIEPTDFTICVKEAGSVEFFVSVYGKSAHGSCVESGENAIHKAIEIISAFNTLSFMGKNDPDIGNSSFNIFKISGGDDELRVPERCIFKVDFRLLPHQDVEDVIEEVSIYLKNHGADFNIIDISPGFEISKEEFVVRLLCEAVRSVLGREPVISGIKSWTDAQHFVKHGIPSVVFGPGNLSVCHTAEERVSIEDVGSFVELLKKVVEYKENFV